MFSRRLRWVIITPYPWFRIPISLFTFGKEVLPEVYWRKQSCSGEVWRAISSSGTTTLEGILEIYRSVSCHSIEGHSLPASRNTLDMSAIFLTRWYSLPHHFGEKWTIRIAQNSLRIAILVNSRKQMHVLFRSWWIYSSAKSSMSSVNEYMEDKRELESRQRERNLKTQS